MTLKPTNVTRLLEARRIPYQAFELPAEKLSAVEVAAHLGVPAEQVFKTIVVTRQSQGRPILALTPGTLEVDLKILAAALGDKKLHLPAQKEAERLTGLLAGGISPLALLGRNFQVVIDEAALLFEHIYISSGQRGLNIRLSPHDLAALCGATFLDFAR